MTGYMVLEQPLNTASMQAFLQLSTDHAPKKQRPGSRAFVIRQHVSALLLLLCPSPAAAAAGRAGNTGAVLRFLQLLPAELAYAHTYNLALKACADAKDLRAALRVVDMMGIRQVPTDFLHFTTLITGVRVLWASRRASMAGLGDPHSDGMRGMCVCAVSCSNSGLD